MPSPAKEETPCDLSLSLSLSLFWCVAELPGQTLPPDPTDVGQWEPPFKHEISANDWAGMKPPVLVPKQALFKALHMALIPRGPNIGRVIVWDDEFGNTNNSQPLQRWSIVDPVDKTMQNRTLTLPGSEGDLFCAGHAWTKDGNLFVVGGTKTYLVGPIPWTGGVLAYLWDPDQTTQQNGWNPQPNLAVGRWYPSVTLDGNDKLLVTGGLSSWDGGANLTLHNTYEAFQVSTTGPHTGAWDQDPTGNRLYPGPAPGSGSAFSTYPRAHLLSNGEVFLSGHGPDSARVLHHPNGATWNYSSGDDPGGLDRHDGSSVLFPIELDPALGGPSVDVVYRMGGQDPFNLPTIHDSLQGVNASTPGSYWTVSPGLPNMIHKRTHLNTVLLPDGSFLAIGGVQTQPTGYVLEAERHKDGAWSEMAATSSPRDYHSTAVLLPSGKVLVGGGDNRTWDYEVYSPPYLFGGARPQITSPPPAPPATLSYGASYTIGYGVLPGVPTPTIQRVVLMRAGSVTHHSCMDQRYVSLVLTRPVGNPLTFTAPANPNLAPRGYYMVFLVTNQGVPSEAAWVHLR